MRVTFIDPDGKTHTVIGEPGESAMRCATNHLVPGIVGECGGAMACATCHLHVSDEWRTVTGEASSGEREMLECANDVDERSRLGCQIVVTAAMDGMTVFTPSSQR